jgi:signal transduction histidine kinase/CheY-like chemotaxis protein/HPt (histidine-containing phosphotransfer) domain-containing protein
MKSRPHNSLSRKLLRVVLGVQMLVAIATLGSAAGVNLRQEQRRSKEIEAQVRESIKSKADVMVDNHALAMRSLALDLALTDMQKLVEHAVAADRDVIYGAFVSAEGVPWAYSSPTLPTGGSEDVLKRSSELSLVPNSWKSVVPRQREVDLFGQRIVEVSRPVTNEGEVLGVIYYGFTTAPLVKALAQVRAESRSALTTTLSLIALGAMLSTFIGFVLVRRASSRIARPLATLTDAAESIASGTKGVRVQVHTDDELEVLAAAFNQMQQANEDAMDQLSRAMEAALEASRLKGEFLANMSHEIRTPMNGIIGISKLMLKLPLEGKLRRYAETIETSANSLMTIINDILDFSKMEAGKYTLQSLEFDPGVLLQEVAELQSGRAWDKGVELVCRRAPDVPAFVIGDPDRYRQILNNLVGNAVKFTDQGEVFVDLVVEERRGDSLILRTVVQDTGIGISEGAQAKLFDAFSQLDGSSVRRHGGTGLGLAISKHLAELMGGKVGLKSEPGVGSSFWFTIEVQRSETTARRDMTKFPEGTRAIVVEANRRWARIIQEHMEAWGMSCDVVQDGRPALDRLKSASGAQPYGIAVVGAQLRDIGIESFVRELRALPEAKKLPLIVLTQLGANAPLSEVEAEVAGQLAKPLRLSELYNCIQGVFCGGTQGSRAPRALARPSKTARGRLLVVDDNETNQYVANELATQAGFDVDIACNGEEAVAKVKAGRYAAVLMDCQMPIMDGYTATRLIREWEGDGRHTPIIALTAHAMVGERDKVVAAGMDDYLSKPLKPHTLEHMLARYVREAPAAMVRPAEAEAEAEAVELDPSLSRGAGLCELFIKHAPRTLTALEAALALGDANAARESAHKLKGSCLVVGAGLAAETACSTQHAAESGDLDSARQHGAELRTLIERVVLLLQRELAETRPAIAKARGSSPPPAEAGT